MSKASTEVEQIMNENTVHIPHQNGELIGYLNEKYEVVLCDYIGNANVLYLPASVTYIDEDGDRVTYNVSPAIPDFSFEHCANVETLVCGLETHFKFGCFTFIHCNMLESIVLLSLHQEAQTIVEIDEFSFTEENYIPKQLKGYALFLGLDWHYHHYHDLYLADPGDPAFDRGAYALDAYFNYVFAFMDWLVGNLPLLIMNNDCNSDFFIMFASKFGKYNIDYIDIYNVSTLTLQIPKYEENDWLHMNSAQCREKLTCWKKNVLQYFPNNGMKLWVDDTKHAPNGYTWVKSVNEAKEVIREAEELGMTIEIVDLDQDAGDYVSDGSDYIKLLDWMAEKEKKYPVRLHTVNLVESANLQRLSVPKESIEYLGVNDMTVEKPHVRIILRKEWFFSHDKNCFGVPVKFETIEACGDFSQYIVLEDDNNNLDITINLNVYSYDAVLWVDAAIEQIENTTITLNIPYHICGKKYDDSLEIEFTNNIFEKGKSVKENTFLANMCYQQLSLKELWKLWEESTCLDGICLDTLLKEKLSFVGFLDTSPEGNLKSFEDVLFLWPGDMFTYMIGRSDKLYLQASFEHIKASVYGRSVDSLNINVLDRDYPISLYNETQVIAYESILEDLDWTNNVKNIQVSFRDDSLWENRYIDIPINYHNHRLVIRIILNPYVLEYRKQPDGSLWLINCTTRCKTSITVPAVVGDNKVTRIGKKAFQWCTEMTSIKISDGVESIASFGFASCKNLHEVVIPVSINEIGRCAFINCEELSSVVFMGALKEIRSYTFYRCRSLKEFIVPEGCEKIGYRAFYYSGLERVVISKNVKEIGTYAFYCYDLKAALPSSLENILSKTTRRLVECGNIGDIDRFREMDIPIAKHIFMGKNEFNKNGTLLMFYDDDYQVIKKTVVK